MQREREEGEGGERGEKERERVSVCEREIESNRECERACVRETETAHVTEGGGGGSGPKDLTSAWGERVEFSRTSGRGASKTIRNVDVRLPGKGNSNSHGERPVHIIITVI